MKIIITGTTGMVGEGVMLECLAHPEVTAVLSVSRKPSEHTHPKLKEYIVNDFMMLKEGDDNLRGYDAVFFCAGVSSVGMKEPDYTRITYDMTLNFAKAVGPQAAMTFIYVSGAGTDSSENGRLMWARVKGKTENDLMKLPYKQVFAFRPGIMKMTSGQKHTMGIQKVLSRIYPVVKLLFPKVACTLQDVGRAMINVSQKGYGKKVIEVVDIGVLSGKK